MVNGAGDIIHAIGNPEAQICMRSCAKPLQAIPVITSGAAAAFKFTDREVALFCGSVSGQELHVAAVRSVLQKVGLTEAALCCGVHPPSHRTTAQEMQKQGIKPGPVHNNCAGKHAAMLALCRYHGWPTENYLPLEHPVQQLILSTISSLTSVPREGIHGAVDGCGVPVFFVPLRNLARAYARLAEPFNVDQDKRSSMQHSLVHLMNAGGNIVESDVYGSYPFSSNESGAGILVNTGLGSKNEPGFSVSIEDNTIKLEKLNYSGIIVLGPSTEGSKKLWGTIRRNNIQLSEGYGGTHVRKCDDFKVTQNRISGKSYYGIRLSGRKASDEFDLSAMNNVVEDNDMDDLEIKKPDRYSNNHADGRMFASSPDGSATAKLWLNSYTRNKSISWFFIRIFQQSG